MRVNFLKRIAMQITITAKPKTEIIGVLEVERYTPKMRRIVVTKFMYFFKIKTSRKWEGTVISPCTISLRQYYPVQVPGVGPSGPSQPYDSPMVLIFYS